MNIREFTFNLKNVYQQMEEAFASHQTKTGLNCLKNCGRCCLNPDIEVSPLEMFPFALKIFDEGKLDEWLSKLESSTQTHCLIFQASAIEGEGRCGSYAERPAICRMFGVAGIFDKHHQVTLSICKFIKEQWPVLPEADASTPLIPDWFSKLSILDPELAKKKLPINEAIKEALERVAFYAQYRKL